MGNIKDTMAHDTINIPEKESSSAAATPQKTYSAQELAEVFLTSRDEFFGIPLEEASLLPVIILLILKNASGIRKVQ